MNIFQAIILGMVQGATEFLPVSSSGHLVIISELLGSLDEASVFFFVLLHVATLLAVVIYFWQDLLKIRAKQLGMLFLATVPAALVGLFLKDVVEALFVSVKMVGGAMLVTGLLNFLSDWKLRQARKVDLSTQSKTESGAAKLSSDYKQLTIKKGSIDRNLGNSKISSFFPNLKPAVLIGVAQAVAITPGISRSGSTVATGLIQGLKKETAFRFSFLLSIPAILGALLLEILDIWQSGSALSLGLPEILGVVAAFMTGLLSLKLFSAILAKNQMRWFGVYAILLGSAVLIFG